MNREQDRGFTLIEILVVMAITVLVTGFLVANFSRSRTDLNQVALTVTNAVREAQSNALTGSLVRGTYRCGYGIHFQSDGYLIFAGPDAHLVDCTTQNRTYDAGVDTTISTGLLPNQSLEIVQPAPDVYFEPPNPTTYIGGALGGSGAVVQIRRKGAVCPGADCRTITVSPSGSVQLQ